MSASTSFMIAADIVSTWQAQAGAPAAGTGAQFYPLMCMIAEAISAARADGSNLLPVQLGDKGDKDRHDQERQAHLHNHTNRAEAA